MNHVTHWLKTMFSTELCFVTIQATEARTWYSSLRRACHCLGCSDRLYAVIHTQLKEQNEVASHQSGCDDKSHNNLQTFWHFGLHRSSMDRCKIHGKSLLTFPLIWQRSLLIRHTFNKEGYDVGVDVLRPVSLISHYQDDAGDVTQIKFQTGHQGKEEERLTRFIWNQVMHCYLVARGWKPTPCLRSLTSRRCGTTHSIKPWELH